jgi:hypothetical protein
MNLPVAKKDENYVEMIRDLRMDTLCIEVAPERTTRNFLKSRVNTVQE